MSILLKRSGKLFSLALVVLLLATLLPGTALAVCDPGNGNGNGDDAPIFIDKKAEKADECLQYEVDLTVRGEGTNLPVDAVLVIDRSWSMSGTPLTNAKAAADFAGKILDANPENRVAVVSYTHWAEINQGLTGSFDSVSAAIDGLSPSPGTNIHDGFRKAREALSDSNLNRKQKYIILMSDGAANRHMVKWLWGNWVVSAIPGTPWPTVHNAHTIAAYNEGKAAQEDAVIYAVGLLGGVPSGSKDVARQTLQRAAKEGPYNDGGYYEADHAPDLTDIYDEIARRVVPPVATGAVVTDIIADGFTYVEGSLTCSKGTADYCDEDRTILWSIDDIQAGEEFTLSYRIKADPGLGNEEQPVPTNDEDTRINFNDDTEVIYFPVPEVYVPNPQISIEKKGPDTAQPGQTITYEFTVTNTGNVSLYNVTVTDDLFNIEGEPPWSHTYGDVFHPGDFFSFSVDYTIPPDTPPGSMLNEATVTGCWSWFNFSLGGEPQ